MHDPKHALRQVHARDQAQFQVFPCGEFSQRLYVFGKRLRGDYAVQFDGR